MVAAWSSPESEGGGRGVGSLRRRRCEIVWEWVASLLEKPSDSLRSENMNLK